MDDDADMDDMNGRLLHIPSLVRQKLAHQGQQGEQWLAELPGMIAHLERAWSITTIGPPLAGGTAAYVARARTAAGEDAILKIAIPGESVADEINLLASAQGRGYVRLLESDLERRAMLLEALGSPMAQRALSPEQMIERLCQTLSQVWQAPRPTGMTLTPETGKARQLARLVSSAWESLGHPCSERVVTQALRYAEQRSAAFDPGRCVVVHGDPHPWNALQILSPRPGAESGFVFVDPDGFVSDPAYDLGVVLRDWCRELLAGDAAALAHHYCALLSHYTGFDETAIWEWGFLERVSSGLYCLERGIEELGQPFLQTAEMLV